MQNRVARILSVVVLLALAVSAPASASKDLKIGIEDESQMLNNPTGAPAIVDEWKKIGIQYVRLFAHWGKVAATQPANASDPNDPVYNFKAVDDAINLITSRGMQVHLTVTGPPASWARTDTSRESTRYKPSASKFAEFATAVAKRYGSKVNTYMIWNEPNVDQWIQPTSQSPKIYRDLVNAATPAIKAADPGAQVLIGDLAPRGKSSGQMKPLEFIRQFACVDKKLKKKSNYGQCKNFKAPKAAGWAHHPHPVRRKPDEENPDKDNAQLGDTPRLVTLLNQLAKKKRIKFKNNVPYLYFTEFGYQTNPPDKSTDAVSLAKQSKYLQQSAYIAYKNPRVKTLTQYEWIDAPLKKSKSGNVYAEWQSGLLFENGTPKPSLETFKNPFWVQVTKGKKKAEFWGQVRPGGATTVTLQRKVKGGSSFTTVKKIKTNSNGYFDKNLTVPKTATYRYTYTDSSGVAKTSSSYTIKKTT